MVNEGLVAGQRRGSGQARVSLMELVQLEQAGFEVLFEGGERGVGHGSNQPKIGIIFPYLCPYRLKGLGQIRVREEARAKGRDHLTQTTLAVRAVCQARPDMTASDALAAVEMVWRQ
jgi:hypothetical protein